MAINYVVQAEVVDIRVDRPKQTDILLVDTNVWLWMTYTVASQSQNPSASAYPKYFKLALAAKTRLYWCGLSMAELAHSIEKAEYDIFVATNPTAKRKEFRQKLSAERASVVSEIQSAWSSVKQIAKPMDVTVDDPTTAAAVARLTTQNLDGYDLFLLEAMAKAGATQLLTDDGDFCTVPGIHVFTANRNVIDAASAQGKLATR